MLSGLPKIMPPKPREAKGIDFTLHLNPPYNRLAYTTQRVSPEAPYDPTVVLHAAARYYFMAGNGHEVSVSPFSVIENQSVVDNDIQDTTIVNSKLSAATDCLTLAVAAD